MSNFHLLSAILRGHWLIEPAFAESHLPVIQQLLEGNADFFENVERENKAKHQPFAIAKGKNYSQYDEAPKGSVAIVSIRGSMMKSDYCGVPGTRSIGKMLKEADTHPNIVGSLLVMDSPGGTVDGTEDLSDIIHLGLKKPIVTFVDSLMASAALWAGTSTKKVIAANKTAQIGSIGTMISATDWNGYYEKMGVKIHTVRADQSKDKNEDYYQMLKGNYEQIKNNMLNPINGIFVNAVKRNRIGKINSEEVFTGKVYLAEDALRLGLIDQIGSFEQAVETVIQLANPKPNNMSFLSNLIKKASANKEELTEEKVEQLADAEVTAMQKAKEDAEAQLVEAQKRLAQLEEEQKTLAQRVQQMTEAQTKLEAENKELAKRPAAPVVVNTEKDADPEAKEAVPVLDVEEKAIKMGAKINPCFTRERQKYFL